MFELSEEHAQIRDMARDFARGEVLPGAPERDKTHTFPTQLVNQLGELGFMGMFVDPEYGGSGMDILSYVLALEEICYADAGVGVTASVFNSLAKAADDLRDPRAEVAARPRERREALAGALTELNAGSDAGGRRRPKRRRTVTSSGARRHQARITNGPQADTIVTYANLGPEQRHRGVCAFILEKEWDGSRSARSRRSSWHRLLRNV